MRETKRQENKRSNIKKTKYCGLPVKKPLNMLYLKRKILKNPLKLKALFANHVVLSLKKIKSQPKMAA